MLGQGYSTDLLCGVSRSKHERTTTQNLLPKFSASSTVAGNLWFTVSGSRNTTAPDMTANVPYMTDGRGRHVSVYCIIIDIYVYCDFTVMQW